MHFQKLFAEASKEVLSVWKNLVLYAETILKKKAKSEMIFNLKLYFPKHIYRAKINHSVRHTNILGLLSKDQGNVKSSRFKATNIRIFTKHPIFS